MVFILEEFMIVNAVRIESMPVPSPLLFPSLPPIFRSYQMARQEEVGDAFPNCIFMTTVSTYQLAFVDLRLHEQCVQIFKRLLVALKLLGSRGLLG